MIDTVKTISASRPPMPPAMLPTLTAIILLGTAAATATLEVKPGHWEAPGSRSVAIDPQGNIILTPELGTVQKWTPDGNLLWTHTIPTIGSIKAIALDDGNILLAGVAGDASSPCPTMRCIVRALDPSGTPLWTIPTPGSDNGWPMATDFTVTGDGDYLLGISRDRAPMAAVTLIDGSALTEQWRVVLDENWPPRTHGVAWTPGGAYAVGTFGVARVVNGAPDWIVQPPGGLPGLDVVTDGTNAYVLDNTRLSKFNQDGEIVWTQPRPTRAGNIAIHENSIIVAETFSDIVGTEFRPVLCCGIPAVYGYNVDSYNLDGIYQWHARHVVDQWILSDGTLSPPWADIAIGQGKLVVGGMDVREREWPTLVFDAPGLPLPPR